MNVIDLQRMVKHRMGTTVTNLLKFWTARRLSAATLLTTMVGFVASAVLMPMHGLVIEHALAQDAPAPTSEVPQLVLATQRLESMIQLPNRPQLTITVVESRAELAQAASRHQVTVTRVTPSATPIVADVSLEEKRALAQAAANQYGIDWKLVEAVWQVESGKRWQTTVRSSMGAQGPMQFMPGTWRAYATDGNGDGLTDVHDARDAVYAGARYLAANGAASNVDQALLRYNHAQWYVEKVKNIANSIEG